MNGFRLAAVSLLVAGLLGGPGRAADDAAPPAATPSVRDAETPPRPAALSVQTLPAWRDLIAPTADELRWREIPWRASFWQAVVDAQEARRPVLLWTMNGHPMGCT